MKPMWSSWVYTYLEPIFNLFGFYRIYSNDKYMNIPLDYYRRQIVKMSDISRRLIPYVKLDVKLKKKNQSIDITPMLREFGQDVEKLQLIQDIIFNDEIEQLMVKTVSGEYKLLVK